MTKNLYPAPGQIRLYCIVSSKKGRYNFITEDIGTNSMMNVAQEYKSKVENAKINAIYKHYKKGGTSDAKVQVVDYDIFYQDKFYGVTRRIETEKRGNKTIKYATAYEKSTGKRLGKRLLRKGDTLE